jgi:hypothetical protein
MSKLAMNLSVDRADPSAALDLWQRSTATTIFTHPTVLAKLSHRVDWWIAAIDGVAVCAWPVCLDANDVAVAPEFGYYIGPFWTDHARRVSPRQRLLNDVLVHQGLLARLLPQYQNLTFALAPGCLDVRSFLWFPGQLGIAAQVNIRPRYTACIDNLQQETSLSLIENFGQTRRCDVRLGARSNLLLLDHTTPETLFNVYAKTMAKDPLVARRREIAVYALIELVAAGFGYVLQGRQQRTGTQDSAVGAVWLMLHGKKRACCAIAAADPDWRQQRFNPWMCHQSLVHAQSLGLDCFDFNGANSFDRGLDKHSFGAEPQLYFDISVRTG